MNRMMMRFQVIALCGLTAGLAGCDALTGLLKLGDCTAGYLTPNEIIAMNQVAKEFLAQQTPPVTIDVISQAQAQAVATFLELNESQCAEEIEALASMADSDPGSVKGLEDLAAAFQGSNNSFDPNSVSSADLRAIFESIFSGQG